MVIYNKTITKRIHPITGKPVIPAEPRTVARKPRIHPITGKPVIPAETRTLSQAAKDGPIQPEKLPFKPKQRIHPITGNPVVQAHDYQNHRCKMIKTRNGFIRRRRKTEADIKKQNERWIKRFKKRFDHVVGTSYKRLTYIGPGEIGYIRCRCSCGNFKDVRTNYINHVQSCGCINRENKGTNPGIVKTHGLSKTIEYRTWYQMHCKCYNDKHVSYKSRGALGITVCDQWKDLHTFIKDIGLRPTKSHMFRRIDKTKNFTPDNCHWTTEE